MRGNPVIGSPVIHCFDRGASYPQTPLRPKFCFEFPHANMPPDLDFSYVWPELMELIGQDIELSDVRISFLALLTIYGDAALIPEPRLSEGVEVGLGSTRESIVSRSQNYRPKMCWGISH